MIDAINQLAKLEKKINKICTLQTKHSASLSSKNNDHINKNIFFIIFLQQPALGFIHYYHCYSYKS